MSDLLTPIIRAVRKQMGPAIPSVCSAHPDVIAAALRRARAHGLPALIEATSNQVNQFGGYTGMTPADFVRFVHDIAADHGLDRVPLILGGDHLGPHVWRALPAEAAMDHARKMVADFVRAGFTKIHLDCSVGCLDEPARLGDAAAAARAAELARVAEAHAPRVSELSYVVGTEVPLPGGALHDDMPPQPTPPERAAATLAAHRDAFEAAGAGPAWRRVRALVVQPGLEYGPGRVHVLDTRQPDLLSPVLEGNERLCFEAHCVDFQPSGIAADLTRRNFGILKVGAALTFAWREALYALSHMQVWQQGGPHVCERIEEMMLARPEHWQDHYRGPAATQRLLRHFGYADRIRYYWPQARAEVQALCDGLDATGVPPPLLLQYLPPDTLARAARLDLPPARAILQAHVEARLDDYYPEDTC